MEGPFGHRFHPPIIPQKVCSSLFSTTLLAQDVLLQCFDTHTQRLLGPKTGRYSFTASLLVSLLLGGISRDLVVRGQNTLCGKASPSRESSVFHSNVDVLEKTAVKLAAKTTLPLRRISLTCNGWLVHHGVANVYNSCLLSIHGLLQEEHGRPQLVFYQGYPEINYTTFDCSDDSITVENLISGSIIDTYRSQF